jgi:hypothetical protein
MDHRQEQAARSLSEIETRREQLIAATRPERLPGWYLLATGLAFFAVGVSTDLPVPLRPIVQLAALLCLIVYTARLTREAPAKLHRSTVRWLPHVAAAAVVMALGFAAGALAVWANLPLEGTVGGIAAALAWWALGPRAHRKTLRGSAAA